MNPVEQRVGGEGAGKTPDEEVRGLSKSRLRQVGTEVRVGVSGFLDRCLGYDRRSFDLTLVFSFFAATLLQASSLELAALFGVTARYEQLG